VKRIVQTTEGVDIDRRRVRTIRHDMKTLRLVEDMAQDRKVWRPRIKVTYFR